MNGSSLSKLTVATEVYSERDKLAYCQRQNAKTVAALRGSRSKIAQALADRIAFCSNSKNLYLAEDLYSKTNGECFDGRGSLWSCNSRLCASCCGKLSKRNRETVTDVLENEKLRLGENWYFVTLTQPDLSLKNCDLLTHRSIMYTAHRKFYRSKFWQKISRGSFKSEEFTLGENDETNFHYHIHKLAICRSRIQRNNFLEIRKIWTDALEFSFRKHGIEFEIETSDGYAVANVQKVRDKRKAVLELCKYVTKNDSWQKLDQETLIKIAEIPRFSRMFEAFGVCKETAKENRAEAVKKRAAAHSDAYLETNQLTVKSKISSERKNQTWRKLCQVLSRKKWLDYLKKQVVVCREYRKRQLQRIFPCAIFETLAGTAF